MTAPALKTLVPDASRLLCAIVDGPREPVQAPIRSEVFGALRFAQHGRSLGATHSATRSNTTGSNFFPRIKDNLSAVREAHHYIGISAKTGYDISPAAEWLLDNFQLIEVQFNEIHAGLARRYFSSLPKLIDEPLAGLPRIYGVAWAFVAHTDGAFDEPMVINFLRAYQEERELNLSEMWALPTTLRVVLIENIRRLSERIANHKAAREIANLCFDRQESYTSHTLDLLLVKLHERGAHEAFLVQMVSRLQDLAIESPSPEKFEFETWLHKALPDPAAMQLQQGANQAADNLSMRNSISSLRSIGDANWPDIIAQTSSLMRLMLGSPVFESEATVTRDQTLHAIEHLAKRCDQSEVAVAQVLLDLMNSSHSNDPGKASAVYWLTGSGRPELWQSLELRQSTSILWRLVEYRSVLTVYLLVLLGCLSVVLWTILHYGTDASSTPWVMIVGVVLAAFPASEAVVALVNRIISESVPPRHLARLEFPKGIPAPHRVMVVIPCMLTGAKSTLDLVSRLELHYLANPETHAQFFLLSDWADADSESDDTDAECLNQALIGIRALNARYPRHEHETAQMPRFGVLHRTRRYSLTEQRWIGWERKRGKLESLMAALSEGHRSTFLDLGNESRMEANTPYVVTLDSDTQLPPGRLRDLVGVASHPNNQPQLDGDRRVVVAGYGILQPRVATPLPAAKEFTIYHWLFSGQCGIDPYSAASSEVYQDVFSEGTFSGKGLLHVKAMHAVLSNRLPDGQVLSHDLLEGAMVRCAVVSDISVLEEAPFHADVAASRVHRWTRGDWQLAPFLLSPNVFGLSALNLWKMLDNLRRSLVAPMSLGLIILSLAGSVMSPWLALALVFSAFTAGPIMGALAGLSPSKDDVAKGHFYRAALGDLVRALCGGLWLLTQLLQQSLLVIDAVGRSTYRMLASRRYLLQWTTAASAQAQARTTLPAVVRLHKAEPVVALLLMGTLLTVGSSPTPWWTVLLCLLWGASPLWTWLVSRNTTSHDATLLPLPDQHYLAGVARDTWRFFERCVGPEDNYLPPDNLQSTPHDTVAHRTSPTNIGLYILSVACARQFGWIGTNDLLNRLEATLKTLLGLQRYRGHFMNWYDTQSGLPLLPLYVSTVDSGNLSGYFLSVAQACLELAEAPFDVQISKQAIELSKRRFEPLLKRRSKLSASQRLELKWLLADYRATVQSAQMDTLIPENSSSVVSQVSDRLRLLARSFESLAWESDLSFLYSHRRHLFHIGFRVAEQQLDAGFYDLLASESRLTSLLAIAKGEVPVRHWNALGRPFFAVGTSAGLRSWTGSMFEYLMPGAVVDEPYGSVLYEASHAALREQMAFGKENGLPWGISESAYAARDFTLAYQYAPHGVPRLALRRTPPDELVIAPYATAMAVQLSPQCAILNFKVLETLGARGRYGFIEALDYSTSGRTGSELFTPVDTVMAHHLGMSIVALANVLLGGPALRWGMANAHVRAMSSLLHERVPREIPVLQTLPVVLESQLFRQREPGLLREVVPGEAAVEPTHIVSNGRYSVLLRANGAGKSTWGKTGINRARDDALRDEYGSFFYVKWGRKVQPVSITQHPAPDSAAHYRSVFHADRVCFDAQWSDLQAYTTVWVSPEDDIEFRQVELRNLGEVPIDIELTSAFEVTLSDQRADEAHPAFANLFVTAEWLDSQQALLFERKPRLVTEEGLKMAHFLTDVKGQVSSVRFETDRQHWRGRNRGPEQVLPCRLLPHQEGGKTEQPLDTGLDPVCALTVNLRIEPHTNARLTFATVASLNKQTLHAVIDKYRQAGNVKRASLMSATLTGIRLRALRISAENFAAMQTLTTALALSLTRVQARAVRPDGVANDIFDRRVPWRFGISGDRPIILVIAGASDGVGLLRSLAQALNLWSWGSVACDLVVINTEPVSYLMPLQRELTALRDRHIADCGESGVQVNTGFHVLRRDELSNEELRSFHGLARVMMQDDGRPLTFHAQRLNHLHDLALEMRSGISTSTLLAEPCGTATVTPPQGQFERDSGEFRFEVSATQRPQRPWINVLANPGLGAHISEAGGGYTWATNSRLNQLTAWSNDPVEDRPSEWFLLQNAATRQVWRMTPSAGSGATVRFHVSHGQGYTRISHRRGDVDVTVTWCVDTLNSVKQIHVELANRGPKMTRLRLTGLVEWLMGANRSDRGTVRVAAVHQQSLPQKKELTALLATQLDNSGGFGGGTAFFGLSSEVGTAQDWTCDRREFFDARGQLVLPDHLGQRSGDGLDPCAAVSVEFELNSGQTAEFTFLLGYATSPEAARELMALANTVTPSHRLTEARMAWDRLLGSTQVKTPDPLFDAMVNRWLLYQTVVCRLWAKAGFYQAGGATGFRDQLQDSLALAWAAPEMLREQIVVCASRQFEAGDVQHWWHAPLGNGVRTHFSDDLLWLAHACVHYLRCTGDVTLLDQPVSFLVGPAIPDGAEDIYSTPTVSEHQASVYEHAARAIDRSLNIGVHGLPLMGSGDWNDGMNRVGIEGRGESVWLGWFLCQLVNDFAPLARQRNDHQRAQRWEQAAVGWKEALCTEAWDGQWFKRAFFDDGQPLGSNVNPEAKIDLIAQAWAVLSNAAPPSMQQSAMAAVQAHLVDVEAGLIRLLSPPLVNAVPSAGYIQAYPPGVRENGGQYSHAGVWALMAQAELAKRQPEGQRHTDTPYTYFTYLSPAHRASHLTQGPVYGLEPYVMAGDVYTHTPYTGRGGWSWYTGAAAWMHRAAIESIFGLTQQAQMLMFNPCLPSHWPQVELTLVRDEKVMRFTLIRASESGALEAVAQPHVRLLRPGEVLSWHGLPEQTHFVIPL